MAKYDWKQLEKEYILSDYKSVKEFLRNKNIKSTGNTNKKTKGWAEKKATKKQQKSNKTIEKVIEKEAENEAQQIVKIKDVANSLLKKIVQANEELNMHLAKSSKRTKTTEYDYKTNKPSKEITYENEEIKSYIDIIDRKGLKELASALKDLNEIIGQDNNNIDAERENMEQLSIEELKAIAYANINESNTK